MFTWLTDLRALLDGMHPGLFNAALAGVLFGAMYLWKRFSPTSFARLPESLQAWPALVVGAVAAALAAPVGSNLVDTLLQALGGTLSGVLAVGTHRVLKESPLPYGNPPKKLPPVATMPPASPRQPPSNNPPPAA